MCLDPLHQQRYLLVPSVITTRWQVSSCLDAAFCLQIAPCVQQRRYGIRIGTALACTTTLRLLHMYACTQSQSSCPQCVHITCQCHWPVHAGLHLLLRVC